MGVYGFPLTSVIKVLHFELTWDPYNFSVRATPFAFWSNLENRAGEALSALVEKKGNKLCVLWWRCYSLLFARCVAHWQKLKTTV